MAKEYTKLNKVDDYDREAAEELAEALNEINDLEVRIKHLQTLVNENKKLHKFVWRTAENKVIAIHKLDDDHLKNILQHLMNSGQEPSKALRAEAVNRSVPLPTSVDWSKTDFSKRKLIDAAELDW